MRTIYVTGMIALLSVAIILAVMPVSAQPTAESLGVEDASGISGTYVQVPMNITNVRNGPVLGIGFEIAYNKSVINITNVSKGNLISNWSEPNVNNNFAWGTKITIAGYYAADAISNGTNGSVVLLNFHVIGSPVDTSPMNMALIELSNPDGVVGTAPARNGTFNVTPAPVTSTPTPVGGGGGSGGGVSGESFANIELKEKQALRIFKDRITSYPFVSPKNPVMFVNITGRSNAGEITVTVEVLHSTSSLVKTDAPDIVYKNLNIWVGTAGFATPENIKEGVIMFRVNRSWIDSNEIDPASITLLRYDLTTDTWNPLPTQRIGKNDAELYYQAATDRFSPFAITGKNASALMPAAAGGAAAEAAVENTANETDISSTSENHAAAVLIIGLIVILVTATALYIYKRKYY